ncbi:hypothetical protein [Pelistega suis]|uniref:Uncharacterized protein n=1 Tax=Pelistega suis TaxID=1631957 RepID=A0A849P5A9_9BURK|nr:hypothetical protein [Pelistega suis]MCQ9328841.1 hypothetical protein [Pelistega suis]NOL51534.1 hypothetical protein [Pelistega suis]
MAWLVRQSTTPTLTWLGNVRMPNNYAGKAVVAGADVSIKHYHSLVMNNIVFVLFFL